MSNFQVLDSGEDQTESIRKITEKLALIVTINVGAYFFFDFSNDYIDQYF